MVKVNSNHMCIPLTIVLAKPEIAFFFLKFCFLLLSYLLTRLCSHTISFSVLFVFSNGKHAMV